MKTDKKQKKWRRLKERKDNNRLEERQRNEQYVRVGERLYVKD